MLAPGTGTSVWHYYWPQVIARPHPVYGWQQRANKAHRQCSGLVQCGDLSGIHISFLQCLTNALLLKIACHLGIQPELSKLYHGNPNLLTYLQWTGEESCWATDIAGCFLTVSFPFANGHLHLSFQGPSMLSSLPCAWLNFILESLVLDVYFTSIKNIVSVVIVEMKYR